MRGIYHVVLQAEGQQAELRLHDRPLTLGERLYVRSRTWVVERIEMPTTTETDPSGQTIHARYFCGVA